MPAWLSQKYHEAMRCRHLPYLIISHWDPRMVLRTFVWLWAPGYRDVANGVATTTPPLEVIKYWLWSMPQYYLLWDSWFALISLWSTTGTVAESEGVSVAGAGSIPLYRVSLPFLSFATLTAHRLSCTYCIQALLWPFKEPRHNILVFFYLCCQYS